MTKSGAKLIRFGAEFRTTPLNYIVNLWSTAPHDPNFLTDAVQRSGWSIVARQIIALPYIYWFVPCLTRRKWGLWKYWSLQSIHWYLYTKRVLAMFFPCYNLSSRAVKLSGGTNPMKIFRRKNSKAPTTNYDSISVSSVGVTPDNAVVNWRIWGKHKSNLCHDFKHAKLHVFSAGWLFANFVSRCRDFVAL